MDLWHSYHEMLAPLEQEGLLRRPIVPSDCQHNSHIYYVLLASGIDRGRVLGELKAAGVQAVFHYVPLHSSPAGRRFGRAKGDLAVTDSVASRLIRLPMWVGLSAAQQQRVCDTLELATRTHLPAQVRTMSRTR
jgi:dTDP-4-amino-4,6-dideoxygalactose transaminase